MTNDSYGAVVCTTDPYLEGPGNDSPSEGRLYRQNNFVILLSSPLQMTTEYLTVGHTQIPSIFFPIHCSQSSIRYYITYAVEKT